MDRACRERMICLCLGLWVVGACQTLPDASEQDSVLDPSATAVRVSPTVLINQDPESTETPEVIINPPTHTPLPTADIQASATPIPESFGIVPDLRGLPLTEARTAALEAGFSYLYQDVLNPEVPPSTIVDQDPPPGTAMPFDEVIYLFRSFQALEMYAGGECQPLLITLPSGKLLYWVELEEGVTYNVRTDFSQGRTQVSDYRMYLIAEFENTKVDALDIRPPAPGRYVISLGPYEVSKSKLAQDGYIRAGCLWITPEDIEP